MDIIANLENNEELPILGISINEETPFGELYLDMFPEWYDVE